MSAPCSASPRAIDCPMPLVPPVTRAVRPVRSKRFGIVGYEMCLLSLGIENERCRADIYVNDVVLGSLSNISTGEMFCHISVPMVI
jgi:hypothetical protein